MTTAEGERLSVNGSAATVGLGSGSAATVAAGAAAWTERAAFGMSAARSGSNACRACWKRCFGSRATQRANQPSNPPGTGAAPSSRARADAGGIVSISTSRSTITVEEFGSAADLQKLLPVSARNAMSPIAQTSAAGLTLTPV